ncbi:MAG: hypothetical protein ABIF09_04585 [Gemmatimonadota bacterium]
MPDQDPSDGHPPEGTPGANERPMEERRLTPSKPVGEEPQELSDVEEGRRPTPVRAAMEGGEDEEKFRKDEPRRVHDGKSGSDWIVRVTGRSASGVLPLRTVPLMELSFTKTGEPGLPLRRALCRGQDLADIPDPDLLAFLKNSEPYREPLPPDEKGRPGRRGKGRGVIRD